jgi:hypothetical protein
MNFYFNDFLRLQGVVFFLICIVGVRVQLGPLGTAATNGSTVLAPREYDDGEIGEMMIISVYRSTR